MMVKKINNKGFLFTVLTFFLVWSVFMLTSFFAVQKMPRDVYAEKTRNIFDDIRMDIMDVLQLTVLMERSDNSLIFSFNDHISLANGTSLMQRYETFVEETFSGEVSANLSLEGTTNPTFSIIPYRGIVYRYPDLNKSGLWVYNESGVDAHAVLGYTITLNFDENLSNVTSYIIPGDLNVSVNATFADSTYDTIASVNRSGNTSWVLTLGNSNVTIRTGRNTINSQIKDSSLTIGLKGEHIEGNVSVGIKLQYTNETAGVRSNILLRLMDGIMREDHIWFVRG